MRSNGKSSRSAAPPTASARSTVAHALGLDDVALTKLGNSDEITRTMKNLVNLGTALGLEATPSFIAGGVAILGYPGRHALQAIADAVGACGKVVC